MIQFLWSVYKPFSQKTYDEEIELLNFNELTCSECGLAGHCRYHDMYTRDVITETKKETVAIQQVRCWHCSKTHALLPTCIVPYSQILLVDHIKILRFHVKGASANTISKSKSYKKSIIDVINIQYIINQFTNNWEKRLLAYGLKLTSDIDHFVKSCFDKYKRQFMQIKKTRNILFNYI